MSKELKAGLLVVAGALIVIFGVNFLKGNDWLGRQNNFWVVYDQVDGLTASNPVYYNGLKVGNVGSLQLHPEGNGTVLVVINITNSQVALRENTVARIVSADLLGSKSVNLIVPENGALLEPGDTLLSEIEEGLKDAVNQQIAPLKRKAEDLIASVDSVLTVLQTVLNTRAVDDINESVRGMRNTIVSLASATSRIDTMVREQKSVIEQSLNNIEEITFMLAKNKNSIERTLQNLSAITDTLAASEIPQAIHHLKGVLSATSNVLEKIERGEGTLGKLTASEDLHRKTMEAIEAMDLLLEDIRYNPERYLHFSVIGRKNKGVRLTPSEWKQVKEMLKNQE